MNYLDIIEKTRMELLHLVNQRCDELIRMYQGNTMISEKDVRECSLDRLSPAAAKGTKPIGVKLASGEWVEIKTWRKAVQVILQNCNTDSNMHEKLMNLRGSVTGRWRIILGEHAEDMDAPIWIGDGLYFEGRYDTETLLHVLVDKVLKPIGFDVGQIVVRSAEKWSIGLEENTRGIQDDEVTESMEMKLE